MANVEEVIKKYVELRDAKATLAKQQSEQMEPLNVAMGQIENWLMHTMNTMGVTQLKAEGVGTAFKATSTSCQMADAGEFKAFVFKPVLQGLVNYLASSGISVNQQDVQQFLSIIMTMPMWDMIDFRAGKKGITEYIENENAVVPGVNINTVATVSIRRA